MLTETASGKPNGRQFDSLRPGAFKRRPQGAFGHARSLLVHRFSRGTLKCDSPEVAGPPPPTSAAFAANLCPLSNSRPSSPSCDPTPGLACDSKPTVPSQGTLGVSGLGQRPPEFGGESSNPIMAKRGREPGISWTRHHLSHGAQLEGGRLMGASLFIVTGIRTMKTLDRGQGPRLEGR